MVTLGVIKNPQRLQFRSARISPEPLSLDYHSNPKASGLTGRISFKMPPIQVIDRLIFLPRECGETIDRIRPKDQDNSTREVVSRSSG